MARVFFLIARHFAASAEGSPQQPSARVRGAAIGLWRALAHCAPYKGPYEVGTGKGICLSMPHFPEIL
jgi:hypothetical protein